MSPESALSSDEHRAPGRDRPLPDDVTTAGVSDVVARVDAGILANPHFMAEYTLDPLPDTGVLDAPEVGLTRYHRRGLPADVSFWCSSLHSGLTDSATISKVTVQRMTTGIVGIWFQCLDQDRASRRGRIIVSGPWDRCPVLPMVGVWHSDSVSLRPGACRALFGIPAKELSNRRVDLEDLLPGEGRALVQRLIDQSTRCARYDVLVDWIRDRIRRNARAQDLAMVTDLQRWIASAGPLRDIAQHTGSSQRQLQRWFNEHIGMTPSAFSHLWQVRRVLNDALTQDRPNWSGLAYHYGFADQAHLVRRWSEVLGESPARFHRRWLHGGRWVDGMIFLPEPKHP
jgi:AraC-like DNA-binding protein